jgi:hypothetical protein
MRWLWLWSFLNAWISVACLVARERLIEKDMFRHVLLDGALFSVRKYFSKNHLNNILLFPKGLKTLHDGTVAFASPALSLKSVEKSDGHDNINWREIYDAPTDQSDLFVEELQRSVKESVNRDTLKCKGKAAKDAAKNKKDEKEAGYNNQLTKKNVKTAKKDVGEIMLQEEEEDNISIRD